MKRYKPSARLLVVGAGQGQVPLIDKAVKMGVFVIAIDRDKNAPGATLASLFKKIDVTDIGKVLELSESMDVDGVLTCQGDVGVRAVGAVVSKLGLIGCTSDVAEICGNKILSRQKWQECNIDQPKFFLVETYDQVRDALESLGGEGILKIPDGSGSRGVTRINVNLSIEDFALIKRLTLSPILLVEQIIDGQEMGAQVFVSKGECKQILLHNDMVTPPPNMVPIGHSFPSKLSEEKQEYISRYIAKCIEALGITDGPANVDLFIDNNRQPKILEIGARLGATGLPDLLEAHTGVDWIEQSILQALGIEPNFEPAFFRPVANRLVTSRTSGILRGIQFGEMTKESLAEIYFRIHKKIGEDVNRFTIGPDNLGHVMVKGATVDEAESLAELVISDLNVEVS
jgi:biotin carboxylase